MPTDGRLSTACALTVLPSSLSACGRTETKSAQARLDNNRCLTPVPPSRAVGVSGARWARRRRAGGGVRRRGCRPASSTATRGPGAWIVRRSAPPSSRCVAYACRRRWGSAAGGRTLVSSLRPRTDRKSASRPARSSGRPSRSHRPTNHAASSPSGMSRSFPPCRGRGRAPGRGPSPRSSATASAERARTRDELSSAAAERERHVRKPSAHLLDLLERRCLRASRAWRKRGVRDARRAQRVADERPHRR